jgi:N6-adenosine-specific RNA methylase IME4
MIRYDTILIDPPWQFKVYSRDTGLDRSADNHYPTLDIEALRALNMPSLMAKDCAMFMWATMPLLPDAIALGQTWGLTYKTVAFVWAKTNRRAIGRWVELLEPANWFMGMGYWTRANVELCLLFTQGKPQRLARDVRQLIVAPIGKHSAKPDETYRRIERLVGGDKRLEIFARQQYPGWDAIGNGIDGRDIREVIG